ncbi:MAG: hypothetical protein JWO31_3395 [Phycisphaerales bacterium]|nr:hypothetical protein [Phycisphaerales bacterium]
MGDREAERERVFQAVVEAFNDLVYLDRRLDKELPWDRLEQLVREGIVTKQEIADRFASLIEQWDVDPTSTERATQK